jgi:hypothetical protein
MILVESARFPSANLLTAVLRHGEPMSHHGIGDDLDEDLVQDRDLSRLRR